MARIVVAGIAKNCSTSIEAELMIIKKALVNHEIVHTIIVESDSSDKTTDILETWSAKEEENTYFGLGNLENQIFKRTERLAFCRNVYMEFLERENFFYSDYLYITDFDGVNELLSANTIDQVICELKKNPDSAATANQLYKYYDIWALRHPIWSPNDCWLSYNLLSPVIGKYNAHSIVNESRMIHIDPSEVPIEVDSAFGGGALYNSSKLNNCRYVGLQDGNEVCEHVAFSADYKKNGGRLFIFPNFINHNISEHVKAAENFGQSLASDSMISYD